MEISYHGMVKIHHLNCASLCPIGGSLINDPPAKLVCHCLLIETNRELILVDTGLGNRQIDHPKQMIGAFRWIMRPKLEREETAVEQIKARGFKPQDVKHIVLTHLDSDHAGGLTDFPNAKVHIFAPELIAAMAPATYIEKRRYHLMSLFKETQWEIYNSDGENWYGFECVRELRGLPPEILMVPLTGHSLGHCGVAVNKAGNWIFHCGDAYFHKNEMNLKSPRCTKGLDFFQRIMQVDGESRLDNQERLRELSRHHRNQIQLFCSHDPEEFAEFSS